ncbi:tyrosine-type recombinase/integrase [Pelagerythrobacter aerophilus]|uniref:Site-specific integrase n=1 Tax=Pelagerythrobacter aerophilus TaxID=2306995 RepID=A0A418NE31_9SPHN|nr:site-specific integrase [Pelagerythrobacter aerophilus]RIV75667.1 site-specific integrase [Pelagerythrobacter aerophilus]
MKVKNAKPGRHGDGEGLYLLVSPTGAKSWVLRVSVKGGKRRDIGLGALSDLSLEEAREKSRGLRKVARAGGDPIAARDKRETAPPSFKDAAQAAHAALAPGWGDRHAGAFLSTLKLHAFPKIGGLRVDSIDEKDLLTVLSPMWARTPAAARKMRQRLGVVLDYAKGMGWRATGAPRDGLRPLLSRQAKAGNFASMPYQELPPFVSKLEAETETMGRLALLLTIYTAARQGETRQTLWSHFDLEAGEWHRPGSIMKNGEPHMVTLSPQALAILARAKALRTCSRDCLVFPGKGGAPLSDMTLSKMVRPLGFTVHGFRSTFRTWAAERMPSVPEAVAEAALSHTIPDKVIRAYNRAKFNDMRRTLLDAWGRYASGQPGDVVQLPLRLGA